MKFPFFYIPAILLLLSACANQGSSSQNQPTESARTASQQALLVTYQAPVFYKRYEGTIANQPVVVYLQKKDSSISGSYFYKKIGKPIALNGSCKNADSLLLEEYDKTAYFSGNGDVTTKWQCVFSKETIKGKWLQAKTKKQFAIDLKESYPQGSYAFEMKRFSDSIKAFPEKEKTPIAYATYEFPKMMESQEAAAWFNNAIKETLGIAANTTIEAGIKIENDSFFTMFQTQLKDLLKEFGEEEYPATWNYEHDIANKIHFNENGIVVLENTVYAYEGGAHGNYASSFYNYDVQQKKLLQIDDVLKIDSTSLQQVLETQFRKDYNIPQPQPLTNILFDKHLTTTHNFYISEKGLGFLYNPYEVAAYAVGQIEVFVPYDLLRPYLTTAFQSRMNL